MNERTRGILLLAAGFVMLFAAVALYWAYDDRDRLAGETSAALLQELEADPAPPAITEEVTITTPEGYELLGAVHIPALDISLPVLATWDEALLDAAPCRYSGSLTTGDLVIMGHSYRTHFRPCGASSPAPPCCSPTQRGSPTASPSQRWRRCPAIRATPCPPTIL